MWLGGGEEDFLPLRLPGGAGFPGCPRVPAVRAVRFQGGGMASWRQGHASVLKGWGRLEGPPATQTLLTQMLSVLYQIAQRQSLRQDVIQGVR